jgi:hypothetical protein
MANPLDNSDPLLTETQAAAFIEIRPGTLSVWRSTKRYPLAFVKVGRAVRYRQSDLRAFLESRRVTCDHVAS